VEDHLYPTLDLHGDTADEAVRRADRWMRARRDEGEATVRLITGKGLHSGGPPVLPGAIGDLLRTLRGTVVRDFTREPGGGAYRVLLRRGGRAAPAPAAVPSLPDEDPALLRAALDALEDLGITPTPALIDAEIRRLRQERG
jgi:hypothetical protein